MGKARSLAAVATGGTRELPFGNVPRFASYSPRQFVRFKWREPRLELSEFVRLERTVDHHDYRVIEGVITGIKRSSERRSLTSS